MPIYEYRCSACGFEKDALQKMADPPLVDCPHCGKPALVKLVSAAGFQLKGSGWYATDFKSSGKKPAESTSADTKGEGGDGKPAEAKPGEVKTAEAKTGDSKSSEKTSSPASTKPPAGPGD